ncbi:hypothetical protein Hanom_Chr10g00880251 [Helianthus anomalus]
MKCCSFTVIFFCSSSLFVLDEVFCYRIWKLGQNALAAASKQQRLGFRQVDAEPVQLTGLHFSLYFDFWLPLILFIKKCFLFFFSSHSSHDVYLRNPKSQPTFFVYRFQERDVFYDVNLNHITTIIQIWYLRLYVCKSTLSRILCIRLYDTERFSFCLTGLSNDKSGIWNSLSSWILRQSRS